MAKQNKNVDIANEDAAAAARKSASIDKEVDKRHNENARASAALDSDSPRIDTDHL
ncbi:hypothetical protein NC661_03725 [Aquibacillus koreensis]|uniref:Uncharacterized protein n=1 Tax=Aquibacillus koreensis TaxID=279446 RepID=A0A9X4AIJ9_9BACI|nr:hypothetical protein [Aquibacillus koreensis]MCT2536441.1 hypothetical protein [Aquibacillus koreensis]MDC3419470.1 hypothetical protein [Aquibacillus koreensis]